MAAAQLSKEELEEIERDHVTPFIGVDDDNLSMRALAIRKLLAHIKCSSVGGEGESGPGFSSGLYWRDISTAPKDGTRILVYVRHSMGYSLGWAYWTDVRGISGWISHGIAEPFGELSLGNPTHWAALTPPGYTEKPKDQTSPSPSPDRAGERNAALEEAAKLAEEWESPLRPGTPARLSGHQEAKLAVAWRRASAVSEHIEEETPDEDRSPGAVNLS